MVTTEERLAGICSAIAEGLVVQDADGRILMCNQNAQRILGLTAGQDAGVGWVGPGWRVIHEDGSPFPSDTHPAVVTLLTGQPLSGVIMGIDRPDGTFTWISVNSRAIPGERKPRAVVVGFTDITGQRAAESALRAGEERWKLAVEGAREGLWDWNAEADEVFVSSRWKEMLGYGDGEIGNSRSEWEDRLHPDDKPATIARLNTHFAGRSPFYEAEYRMRCKDGTWKWIRARGSVVSRAADGTPLRFLGVQTDITERKEAERALRDAERRSRVYFEQAPLGIAVVECSTGRFRQVNAAYCRLVGRAREELYRMDFQSLTHPDDVAASQEQMARLHAGEVSEARIEKRYLRPDGSVVWISLRVVPLWGHGDQPALQVAMAEDVTERKRAEASLREAFRFNQQVLDSARDGVVVFGLDLRYRVWNRFMESMTGVAAKDVLGRHPAEVFPFLAEAGVVQVLERVLARGLPERIDFPYSVPESGRSGWTSHLSAPLRNDAGQTVGVIATVREITERKLAEEQLRTSEARFRAIIENSHDGIVFADADGLTLYRSPSYRLIDGYDAEERVGLSRFDKVHPDDLAAVHSAWAEALGRREAVEAVQYRTRHKDGRWIWVETSAQNLLDNPDVQAVILAIRDITDRKRADEEREKLSAQLAQAQKMESIGRLAGGVAHDFNNQLTVINGYSKMALAGLRAGDPLRNQLEEIRKAGDRAASLTGQLLAFSRKQMLQPRVLDLNRVVEDMHAMLRRLMGEDVEVRASLAAESPKVRTDPHQLEQAIMNLAVNARDAMPNGGRLLIETGVAELDGSCARLHADARPGRYAVLAVSDTGVGMDEATRQRIFEPFFTTKQDSQGTGLGLSMIQGVVAQSGGFVSVYSEPGHGTTFRIYLPAPAEAAVEAGPQAETEEPAAAPNLRGKETILLVEDQAEVRDYAVALLKGYGYRVIQAANAGEALIICEQEHARIHLVLTDVVMPRTSGPELVARLAGLRPGMKALFMSGYTDETVMSHNLLNEGAHFIQKPFSPEELAAKVRQVLGPAQAARILVADDEAGVRSFLRAALEAGGYEVVEAADGGAALRQALAGQADLAIVDLVMPEQEGIETIQALRRDVPRMGIIAISGAFGGQYLRIAEKLGADAVLKKPVSDELLLAKVAEVLTLRR